MEEARKLIEEEGISVVSFIEEDNGAYFFLCKTEDGTETEVCVDGGKVYVSPT